MDPARSVVRELDARPAATIGRHARLELSFAYRSGRTVLTHAYAEPPLRVGPSFDVDGAAYLILVCSAPGVFAGDCLRQRVTVGRGARVLLASQSALQVHPGAVSAPAAVHHEYSVEEGGELHCHWDPVIPFAGARFVQRFDVRLASESGFYWSDALMSGRASRGEAWRFASLDHELRLAVDGSLRYLERYALEPAVRKPWAPWLAGGAHYAGTVLVRHPGATPEFAEGLQRELSRIDGVAAGVDLIEARLLAGRLLAPDGAPFARARAVCRDAVLASVFGRPRLIGRR